jgi:2-amino-4-hydroxy-6-hydroxymethyldihydropteridine diphosphokinase
MILVALGSNQHGPWGSPQETMHRAVQELNCYPTRVLQVSTFIVTVPFGRKNQPDFINAVAHLETRLPPETLLRLLQGIERRAGRSRSVKWGPRTLDLDIIDYHGRVVSYRKLQLPHAGISERTFVLVPIAEIAHYWKHPVNHRTAQEMLAASVHASAPSSCPGWGVLNSK